MNETNKIYFQQPLLSAFCVIRKVELLTAKELLRQTFENHCNMGESRNYLHPTMIAEHESCFA